MTDQLTPELIERLKALNADCLAADYQDPDDTGPCRKFAFEAMAAIPALLAAVEGREKGENGWADDVVSMIREVNQAKAERDALQAEVGRARAALKRYGQHDEDCSAVSENVSESACDCGFWIAALAKAEK
ncbi:MAG: hypothetical protein ACHQC8_02595 [Solirubrobacterales bacterium]